MKKRGSLLLLALALVFGAFCLGFFLGRNYTQAPVQVSTLQYTPVPTVTAATEATAPAAVSRAAVPDTSVPTESLPLPSEETTPVSEPPIEQTTAPASEPVPESTAESTEPPTEESTSAPVTSTGLIDINTADQATLMTLPGIGETLSQRIIDYRSANGPFGSVSELLNVSGIGEKRLAAIIDYICAGG